VRELLIFLLICQEEFGIVNIAYYGGSVSNKSEALPPITTNTMKTLGLPQLNNLSSKIQDEKEIEKKLDLVVLKERLTSKEARFVDLLLMGEDEYEAARQAGFEKVDSKLVKKLLENIDIQQYIVSAQELFSYMSAKAVKTVYEIMEKGSEKNRLEAAKIVLDKTVADKKQMLPVKMNIQVLNINNQNGGSQP